MEQEGVNTGACLAIDKLFDRRDHDGMPNVPEVPNLSEEQRRGLPPAVQTYLAYLEGLVRSISVLDVDLETASREELIGLVFRLLERQQVVEARLRELERLVKAGKGDQGGTETRSGSEAKGPASGAKPEPEQDPLSEQPGGKQPPDWVKPNRSIRPKKERKKREHGYARRLDKPTHRVEHAYAECPECQVPLTGGKVSWRRQVISLPRIQVRVTEHVVIERKCDQCSQTWRPKLDLSKEVVGQQRMGISVQSEVAVLREGYRLPYWLIQRYLSQSRGLHLSMGELVNLSRGVAERGKAEYEALRQELSQSPVVNGDETGWREDGRIGCTHRRLPLELQHASGALLPVSTESGGERGPGGTRGGVRRGAGQRLLWGLQRACWGASALLDASVASDPRAQAALPPGRGNGCTHQLAQWAKGVHEVYERAKAYAGPDLELPPDKQQAERVKAQRRYEQELWLLCEPYVKTDTPMRVLCERIERFLPELFMFIADPRVPADNNAAERSLRGQVVSRKISGGTRSDEGSETKSILASLFGTWQLQGRNLYQACRRLLISEPVPAPAPVSVRSPPT
jgi:hypothetical protein